MPIHEEDRLARRALEMEICGECGELTGRVETSDGVSREQVCHCLARRTERLWPRHDYNTAIELCYACTARPIRCGSRLSLFYCRECLWNVNTYNGRARTSAQPRSYIPVGRHSILHDIMYFTTTRFESRSTEPEPAPAHFTASLDDLVARISVVRRWRRDRVRAVVQGWSAHRVSGDVYLARAREIYEPADAVAQLAARIEELGPPPYPVRVPRSATAWPRRS